MFSVFLWVEITRAYSQEERNGQEKGKAEDVESGRGIDGAESQSPLEREKDTGTGRSSPGWRRATALGQWRRAARGLQREQAER